MSQPKSNQVGAREFWATQLIGSEAGNFIMSVNNDFIQKMKYDGEVFHVIEYQALIDERKRVEGLVGALGFYADEKNWNLSEQTYDEDRKPFYQFYEELKKDSDELKERKKYAGKRAREALVKLHNLEIATQNDYTNLCIERDELRDRTNELASRVLALQKELDQVRAIGVEMQRECNRKLTIENDRLRAQIENMNKNCISRFLHEQRMKQVETDSLIELRDAILQYMLKPKHDELMYLNKILDKYADI